MKLLYICKIYFDRFIRITYRSLFDYRAPGDHWLWQPAVRRGRGVAAAAAPALPPHTQLRRLYGLQSGADQAGAADAQTERTVPDYRRWSCYRFRYVQHLQHQFKCVCSLIVVSLLLLLLLLVGGCRFRGGSLAAHARSVAGVDRCACGHQFAQYLAVGQHSRHARLVSAATVARHLATYGRR